MSMTIRQLIDELERLAKICGDRTPVHVPCELKGDAPAENVRLENQKVVLE